MSAGGALQVAIAAALNSVGDLHGVFDGPPARAAYPYVTIDASTETDWSHKSGQGREVRVAITLWDDQPVRLHDIADLVEAAMDGVTTAEGWQLVSLRQVRRKVIRDVSGPWGAAVDYRARMLALA
jgi:hypothetical protein